MCDDKDNDCDGNIDEMSDGMKTGPIILEKSYPPAFGCPPFEGYTWMGWLFYLEHPSFFFLEIFCFFRGHRMKRYGLGMQSGEAGPVGEYACTTCGQVLDMKMGRDELRRYAKHGFVRVEPNKQEGEQVDA